MVRSTRMRAYTLVNTLVSTINRTILTKAWLLNGPELFHLVSCVSRRVTISSQPPDYAPIVYIKKHRRDNQQVGHSDSSEPGLKL